MTFNYRLVKCSHCGSTTALEFGVCQKCGHELKKPQTANFILLGIGGAVLVIVFLSLLMFLTRDTVLGGAFALIVLALSLMVGLVSQIWLIIAAFQVSGMWGVACIIFPLASLAFVYKHTDRALMPFTLNILSIILLLIASFAIPTEI